MYSTDGSLSRPRGTQFGQIIAGKGSPAFLGPIEQCFFMPEIEPAHRKSPAGGEDTMLEELSSTQLQGVQQPGREKGNSTGPKYLGPALGIPNLVEPSFEGVLLGHRCHQITIQGKTGPCIERTWGRTFQSSMKVSSLREFWITDLGNEEEAVITGASHLAWEKNGKVAYVVAKRWEKNKGQQPPEHSKTHGVSATL